MDKAAKHERVLLLLPGLDIGGAQEVVRTLAKHLVSDECTPVVFFAASSSGSLGFAARAKASATKLLSKASAALDPVHGAEYSLQKRRGKLRDPSAPRNLSCGC